MDYGSVSLRLAEQTLALADNISLLQAVKVKLISQSDPPAADKLSVAIEELGKIYKALENGLTEYLALSFYKGQEPGEQERERRTLLALEGGEIGAEIRRARAHCKKILNIYLRFLSPWFSSVLNYEEQHMMRTFFGEFEDADFSFVNEIENLANRLSDQARMTLDLVDAGKLEEANQAIRKARVEFLPLRKRLRDAINRLADLEADFTELSGTV